MLLKDWLAAHPGQFGCQGTDDGASWVVHDDFGEEDRAVRNALWHLDDYVVSSVAGGCIWLQVKPPAEQGSDRLLLLALRSDLEELGRVFNQTHSTPKTYVEFGEILSRMFNAINEKLKGK